MQTLKQVIIEPIYIDGFMPHVLEMDDHKIYISEEYETSNHKCLCGCGQQTILPINNGKSTFGWNLIKEDTGKISFTPSIQNPPPCNAHYVITKNVANILSYDIEKEEGYGIGPYPM